MADVAGKVEAMAAKSILAKQAKSGPFLYLRKERTGHGHAAENMSTNALIVPATFSSETCQAAPSSAA
jgi:hypothetical protein